MKKRPIYIFFDDVIKEYQNYYKEKSQEIMIKDLKKYLFNFSKNSKIFLITKQNLRDVIWWLYKNDLYKFIYDISNPII